MLAEIVKDEALPVGWILSEGHHLSCSNNHSYAMTSKTMAVGNPPDNDGPNDAFMVTPIAVNDENGNFLRWDKGPVVAPLSDPFSCPVCGLPLGIR